MDKADKMRRVTRLLQMITEYGTEEDLDVTIRVLKPVALTAFDRELVDGEAGQQKESK